MGGVSSLLDSAHLLAQRQIEHSAANLINVENPNYSKTRGIAAAQVSNGKVNGVGIAEIKRFFDKFLTEAVQQKKAESSYTETVHKGLESLQPFFGLFGSEQTSAHLLTKLLSTFANFAQNPVDPQGPQNVKNAAERLEEHINQFAKGIQDQRKLADEQIGIAVEKINSLLDQLAENNRNLSSAGTSNQALMDRQDKFVEELSQYLSVSAEKRNAGGVTITSKGGVPLLISSPRYLSFQASTLVGPHSTYPDGGLAGILDSEGNDVTDKVTDSGQLRALIELRDNILPGIQAGLDEFTVVTKEAMNVVSAKGSGYPPVTTLTGSEEIPGTNDITRDSVAFAGVGTLRVALVNKQSGIIDNHIDIDLTTLNTVGNLRDAINGMQAGTATYTNGKLQLTSGSPGLGVVIGSVGGEATVTHLGTEINKGVSHAFGLRNFWDTNPAQPSRVLTGDVLGMAPTDNIQFTNTIQVAIVDKDSGNIIVSQDEAGAPTTLGDWIDVFNNPGSAIKAAVPTFSMGLTPEGALQLDTGNPQYGVRVLSIGGVAVEQGIPQKTIDEYFKLRPTENPRAGASYSFRLRDTIRANPEEMSRAKLTDQPVVADGVTMGLTAGNVDTLNSMLELRNSNHTFSQAGELSSTTATLTSYASSLVGSVSTATADAKASAEKKEEDYQQAYEQNLNYKSVNLEEELNYFVKIVNYLRLTGTAQSLYDQVNTEVIQRRAAAAA